MTDSTAVAVAAPKKPALPDAALQMLDQRRKMAEIAAKVAEQNWGKGLDVGMRNAVASYLREHALDVTEVHVLGGNIYRNAAYYLRRLSEMVEAGLVDYARHDHVHVDARLEKLAAGGNETAKTELDRRAMVRAEFNAPDEAKAVVVFRLKLKSVSEEFVACKWAGNGTRKNDPVGESFPVESAETRAARRCLRLVASQMPTLKRIEDALDEAADVVSLDMVAAYERARDERNRLGDGHVHDPAPKPPAVDDARNKALARYEALMGKAKRTDDDDAELADLLTDYPDFRPAA